MKISKLGNISYYWDMYVMYNCPECKESVDSNMIECPNCQAFLPDYAVFDDIADSLDQEMYEQMHPLRARATKAFYDYLDDHYKKGAEGRKIKREQSTLYYWCWQAAQLRWSILIASAYLGLWITPAYLLIQPSEVADLSWIWFGIVALVPLQIVAMWLEAKNDTRNVSFQQKIIQNSHTAFNKLGYSILILFLFYYSIYLFVEYTLLSLGVI